MPKMRKKTALTKLAKAIKKVVGECYDEPKVFGPPMAGWPNWLIAWDGPYEWTLITCGASVFAGEMENYSLAQELPIEKVIAEIEEAGWYLEPANSAHINIWEA